MLVDDLNSKYAEIAQNYPSNSTRKNYFLAASMVLIQRNSPNIGSSELWAKVAEMDSGSPHGGIIGMGNSKWEKRLNKFKIIRFHAVLHDAGGHLKRRHNIGPGYIYASSCCSCCNNPYLGHVSGLIYCLSAKLFCKSYRKLQL
ncbi:uncharacterized protein LOC142349350 [Convolutriloba macropyga]|uniref:uncharacterized protein LOC142349350 n=1 Tax=Convolutriloba macropyga TaxID=536237 RepID=UPI003F51FC71